MYYDIPLVTFGVDRNMNLVIQFPIFLQAYIQEPLFQYQIETIPVPILDTNTEANSYTHLHGNKPYIALNKGCLHCFYVGPAQVDGAYFYCPMTCLSYHVLLF